MTRAFPEAKHVPANDDNDTGELIRQRAAEACGYRMGQDIADSRAEVERNGGAAAVVDRAVKRVERGQQ